MLTKETYTGLKATKTVHKVTDAEVAEYLEKIRQGNARTVKITERPAQENDEVIIDYAGFVGDEQFAGGTAEGQALVLGSGTFIPGFEEQLMGASVGDKVDVKVTFPEVYHAPDLAGKEAVFHCTVHEIHEKRPYELDDSFAKDVAGLDTVDEMREVLRGQMQSSANETADNELVDSLLWTLAENCGIEPDAAAIEKEIDNILNSMAMQLQQQGASLEDYVRFTGRSMEDLREAQRPQAQFGAKVSAALNEICKIENIEATEADYDMQFEYFATQCGISAQQIRDFYTEGELEALAQEICQKKAVALMVANAEITTVEK